MEQDKVEEYKIQFTMKIKFKESSYSWDTTASQDVELTVPAGEDPKDFLRRELSKGYKQITDRKIPYGGPYNPEDEVVI